jgi:two-component system chemotaxis response regulator CheY
VKVLIVEDDLSSSVYLEKMLPEGTESVRAADGEQALTLFAESLKSGARFDIVFVDLLLPKLDGHEVLLSIREFEEESAIKEADSTPLVVVTSVDCQDSLSFAKVAGCVDYLQKPIAKKAVNDVLERIAR